MSNFLKFKGVWRDYQKRILDSLLLHLSDNKLHVVAAPGAGKTTLGIEIISRIDKPTLVLAPTITIRNQWKQRIIDAFLNTDDSNFISLNIRQPKFITITTYQALLASFCGNDDESEILIEEEENENICNRFNKEKADEIISVLKHQGISLLCFDEAHHLRKEWWKALNYLMENLKPKQTLSLTATPPYDADVAEWERYQSLCGQIDEVISIPELVQNNDLCPHQDFIYFSLLRKNESDEIDKNLKRISAFIDSLFSNKSLIKLVQKILNSETDENLLEEPQLFVSFAAFLKTSNSDIPENFLQAFDFKYSEIPAFSSKYQKIFLSYFLVKNKIKLAQQYDFIEKLHNSAKVSGVIFNKTVCLDDNPKIKRQIANSIGKLDSIKEIVDLEAKSLMSNLRMVILTDYIKYNVMDCSELGVIPIWQTLKDRRDISLGVLTGSIALIPQKIKEEFLNRVEKISMQDDISLSEFERDSNYLQVKTKGSKNSIVVEMMTDLFNDGFLTVLVGTQALLGEGWDAPSINSLILSSTVSSYMLSNQMRGRAIRKDRNNPDKISNIWHLASIKILSNIEQIQQILPSISGVEPEAAVQIFDFYQLVQRFKGYQAPSFTLPVSIENGIERILPVAFNNKINNNISAIKESDFLDINNLMRINARNRKKTKELWQSGLVKSYNSPSKSLKNGVSSEIEVKNFYYKAGYFYKLYICFFIASYVAFNFGLVNKPIGIIVPLVIFIVLMFNPTIKYLRCSSPEKIMRQIGIVILETLYSMGEIKTSLQNINIQCREDSYKCVFFSIDNLSPEENNLVINSLIEFVNPIENPRYIFIRKTKLHNLKTIDYHAIPSKIAQKKEYVEVFKLLWNKYISECDIYYTRSKEGRKFLLNARKMAFSDLVKSKKAKKISRFE